MNTNIGRTVLYLDAGFDVALPAIICREYTAVEGEEFPAGTVVHVLYVFDWTRQSAYFKAAIEGTGGGEWQPRPARDLAERKAELLDDYRELLKHITPEDVADFLEGVAPQLEALVKGVDGLLYKCPPLGPNLPDFDTEASELELNPPPPPKAGGGRVISGPGAVQEAPRLNRAEPLPTCAEELEELGLREDTPLDDTLRSMISTLRNLRRAHGIHTKPEEQQNLERRIERTRTALRACLARCNAKGTSQAP